MEVDFLSLKVWILGTKTMTPLGAGAPLTCRVGVHRTPLNGYGEINKPGVPTERKFSRDNLLVLLELRLCLFWIQCFCWLRKIFHLNVQLASSSSSSSGESKKAAKKNIPSFIFKRGKKLKREEGVGGRKAKQNSKQEKPAKSQLQPLSTARHSEGKLKG